MVRKCLQCGSPVSNECEDLCDDCLSEYENPETAVNMGKTHCESTLINGFLLGALRELKVSVDEVVEEWFNHIDKKDRKKIVDEYIGENRLLFVDTVEKEYL